MHPQLSATPKVGVRLHHARRLAGLTLKQLAQAAGCSESLLSKIEHDRTQPSLAMLSRIANALGSSVSALTHDSWSIDNPVLASTERTVRLVPQQGGVLACESLARSAKNALLKGEILHFAPGLSSDIHSQIGHALGYVLEGQLVLCINKHCYHLSAGDSLSFDASQQHYYQNPSNQTAKLLWVVSPAGH